ncbi:MAG: fumarylacetoacetate hydrolase family protein [Phycisphaeraceae bacterium]|nr:fumarylacetoacetate hydrolase family protein [Phycisphaeraceae bacterium]
MRILRFRGEDNRVHLGTEKEGGRASLLADPHGVLDRCHLSEPVELLHGLNAVVADDDDNMRRMMATVLTRFGCRCVACRDGAEAIDAIHAGGVDLVVSDIRMPFHDGYEIFAAARRMRDDLPVVLVTGFGYDPSHSLIRASREGLAAVLYKPFAPAELLQEVMRALRSTLRSASDALLPTGEFRDVCAMLAPVRPANLIGIGRNWRQPGEMPPDIPLEDLEVFVKPTGSVLDPGGTIRIPTITEDPHLHAEAELAIVIGLDTANVPREQCARHIVGYTIGIDVTALHFQDASGPPRWMRGKGFDTFCPLGPVIIPPAEMPPMLDVEIRTCINGGVTRRGRIRDMIRGPEALVADLSRHCTLPPGSVILTGGPPLVALGQDPPPPLRSGDEVVAEIDGIGRLSVRVG